MKLKKILKYIDSEINVRIWYADNPSKKYKMWTGAKFEIPKKFKKYQLVEAENKLNESKDQIFADFEEKYGAEVAHYKEEIAARKEEMKQAIAE